MNTINTDNRNVARRARIIEARHIDLATATGDSCYSRLDSYTIAIRKSGGLYHVDVGGWRISGERITGYCWCYHLGIFATEGEAREYVLSIAGVGAIDRLPEDLRKERADRKAGW